MANFRASSSIAEQLKRGVHQLKFDPSYTAAKKVGRAAWEQELEEHEAVSRTPSC